MELGQKSVTGASREANEDRCLVAVPSHDGNGVRAVLAVADGMGGHAKGEVASSIAVEQVEMALLDGAETLGAQLGSDPAAFISALMSRINDAILEASQAAGHAGMGTTLTLAVLSGSELLVGHVGDSRAYLINEAGIQRLTHDHNWPGELEAVGQISAEEAMTHPRRNVLTRCLGATPNVRPDIYRIPIYIGNQVMVCSDGLTGAVSDAEIAELLLRNAPQTACDALVDLAVKRGSSDDITVVALRI